MEKETIFNKNKNLLYWLIIIIGVAIIYSIITITNNINSPTRELSFEGKASRTVEPDIAEFTINLSEDGTSTASAQAKLKDISDKLFTSIKDLNIDEKDIQTTNVSSEPKWEYPNCAYYATCSQARIVGYTSKNTIVMKVRDIDNIQKLITIITNNKINSYTGPNWKVDDIDEIKEKLKLEAISDAKSRAESITDQLGLKITGVSSYWENNNPPNAQPIGLYKANSIMAATVSNDSMKNTNDIYTGETKLEESVNVTYRVR